MTIFKIKFKLIAGREYFEGDEMRIVKIFIENIYNHNNQDFLLEQSDLQYPIIASLKHHRYPVG